MFNLFKKKLKEIFGGKVEGKEEKAEEKVSRFKLLFAKKIEEEDLQPLLKELKTSLLDADASYEVCERLEEDLVKNMVGKQVSRWKLREQLLTCIRQSLYEILNVGCVDMDAIVEKAKKEGRPTLILFFGINGVGKSLSLAKLANFLSKKYKVLLAAGDTFRAAGIEQLQAYASQAGLQVVAQKAGADSCAVIFDARKAAERRGFDLVLADTSGRMHTKKNLLDELKKIVRVNKPDLKVLVLDSLAGSDVVPQFEFFDQAVGIDAVVFTKVDVNEKGGNLLSVCYSFKKPILFLGTGQRLEDLEFFDPSKFVSSLLQL